VKAQTKGWIAALILGAAVVGAVGWTLWHLWRAHEHSVAWGDVPTWVESVVVFFGLPAALLQLRMQRIQLREQQRELAEHRLLLDRQQANKVNLTRESSDSSPATYSAAGRVWMAVITNGSERPIRDVASRIQIVRDGPLMGDARIGELIPNSSVQNGRAFQDLPTEHKVAIIRIDHSCGFAFGVGADRHPMAQVAARFTDDAGLHWQLDQDLHLKKLVDRSEW
jgi:hypothetical protein